MQTPPVLYSFRRCPYAIRARMALACAGIRVELREVLLRNKPPCMLRASAKGTVPVLCLANGEVLEESLDIMRWAVQQSDPERWLDSAGRADCDSWIEENDGSFKGWLDRYKYADRHPEQSAEHYRDQGLVFLRRLDARLAAGPWLSGLQRGLTDVAIFPFVRQFAMVDRDWFDRASPTHLRRWLHTHLESSLFTRVMAKHTPWSPASPPLLTAFPADAPGREGPARQQAVQ